jgi:hypothetical protein
MMTKAFLKLNAGGPLTALQVPGLSRESNEM